MIKQRDKTALTEILVLTPIAKKWAGTGENFV